ncbi:MAG: hypothetical protein AABW67_04180 [Nanoarchaeota archaeon]
MNRLKLYSIIVTIILLIGLSYLGYVYISNKGYVKGYNEGQEVLIKNMQSTGNIPLIENGTIKTYTIQQICNGVGK